MVRLIKGKSTLGARTSKTEIDILSTLLCKLMPSPHVLLVDALEHLSSIGWQMLAAVVELRPPVAFIFGARDLHSFVDGSLAQQFDELVASLTTPSVGYKQSFRATPTVDYTVIELLPLDSGATIALLTEAFNRESISERLSKKMFQLCGGNPSFLLAAVAHVLSALPSDPPGGGGNSKGSLHGMQIFSDEEFDQHAFNALKV